MQTSLLFVQKIYPEVNNLLSIPNEYDIFFKYEKAVTDDRIETF